MIGAAFRLARVLRAPRLPAVDLARLRDARLRSVVAHACAHVPYYRALFRAAGLSPQDVRTVADLARLPVSTKEDLRRAGAGGAVSEAIRPGECRTFHTSGTSGTPLAIRVARDEIAYRHMVDFRALLSAGVTARDRIAILGPGWTRPPGVHDRLGLWRTAIVRGDLSVDDQVSALRAFDPTVLWAYPTVLRALLHRLDYRLADACRPRMLVTSSEPLDAVLRERLAACGSMQTFDFYGANEVGRIAQECPAHDGLHVNADLVVLEAGDGAGGTIVTSLVARAMPFLRYRLGDRCAELPGPCVCGSAFPRISAPEGRATDMIVLPSGRLVSPWVCEFPLRAVPGIDQFRLVQSSPSRLLVQIVPGPAFPRDGLLAIAARLRASLPEPVDVDAEFTAFLRGETAKFRVFASRVRTDSTSPDAR